MLFDGRTNHPNNALALDHTAFLADFFDRRANFHGNGLLMSIDNSTFGEIVGGEFNRDQIPRQDTNVVHADLSRDVRKYCMALVFLADQHNSEGCVGKAFQYLPFYLDDLLGHKNTIEQKR